MAVAIYISLRAVSSALITDHRPESVGGSGSSLLAGLRDELFQQSDTELGSRVEPVPLSEAGTRAEAETAGSQSVKPPRGISMWCSFVFH